MPTLSIDELYELVRSHGAEVDLDRVMVAGALTESGGNTDAIGDGGHSVGLWQMHDQGLGFGMTVAERKDPDRACEVMLPAFQRGWANAADTADAEVRATRTYLDAERPEGFESLLSTAATHFRGQWRIAVPRDAGGGLVQPPPLTSPVEQIFDEIVFKGCFSDNFARGRQGIVPEAIVLHIAEGTLGGVDGFFNRAHTLPGEEPSSAHFCVGKKGELHQYVNTADTAFANGRIEPGATAKLIAENAGINPNLWTISIEHEGRSGDEVSNAQWDTTTRLGAWLFRHRLFNSGATGVAVDRNHILRHGDISAKSRARCPGWDELVIQDYVQTVARLLAE
jgi:hypothetical protein